MEHSVALWAATVLTAKIFAGAVRREFGLSPEPIATLRSGFSIDAAYLAILAVCVVVVYRIGTDTALPVALLLRAGSMLNTRIVLTANHYFLELFALVFFLRLGDSPATLAAVVQIVAVSVWLYAVFQKLYHRQFADGSFFYIAFQDAGTYYRWKGIRERVARLDRYYAAADPVSQQFCKRLATLALATEAIPPVVGFAANGTIGGFLIMASVSGAVAAMSRETSFLITNLVLSAFFLVPFDAEAFWRITDDPLAAGLLAFAIVWPPLHAILARALGFSTWKLGGWGMYATIDPRVSLIGSKGEVVAPVRSTPYGVLQVCGSCRIPALREYARQLFLSWEPAKDTIRAFLYRRYEKRGPQYVSVCIVVPNVKRGVPARFELTDETSLMAFKRHIASFRVSPSPEQPEGGRLHDVEQLTQVAVHTTAPR